MGSYERRNAEMSILSTGVLWFSSVGDDQTGIDGVGCTRGPNAGSRFS